MHLTDGVSLGESPLPEGGTMTFRFDYGDEWWFSVTLERIGPPDRKRNRPKLIAKAGRAPQQYRSEDDW